MSDDSGKRFIFDGAKDAFPIWVKRIYSFMTRKGLGECIQSDHIKCDSCVKAGAVLIGQLGDEPMLKLDVEKFRTAKQVLDELKRLYVDLELVHAVPLAKKLTGPIPENESPHEHAHNMIRWKQKLGTILDSELPEKFAMILFLQKLDMSYDPFVLQMEQQLVTLDMQLLASKVEAESTRQAERQSNPSAVPGFRARLKPLTCYRCQKPGHTSDVCPLGCANCGKAPAGHTLFKCPKYQPNKGDANSSYWTVDSGAGRTMTGDASKLHSLRPANQPIGVQVANGTILPAIAEGDSAWVNNALLVPGLTEDLLSVCQLVDNNGLVVFSRTDCYIFDDKGNLVALAPRNGDRYQLDATLASIPGMAAKVAPTGDSFLWHCRLSHASLPVLSKAFQALGLAPPSAWTFCDTCALTKQKQHPFGRSKSPIKCATRPLERVHADFIGPITPSSQGGSKYILNIIDEYTRRVWEFPLKFRHQVSQAWKSWCAKITREAQTKSFDALFALKMSRDGAPTSVTFLRCDGGKEFGSQAMKELLEGVQVETTAPYAHQMNGLVERANLTVESDARALLTHCGLPKTFWRDAVAHAVYTYNRRPHSFFKDGSSPMKMWYGTVPCLEHLKVFGCDAYARIPPEISPNSAKFSETAERCIHLGRTEDDMGYRLLRLSDRQVVTRVHVLFNEVSFTHVHKLIGKDQLVDLSNTDPVPETTVFDTPDGPLAIDGPIGPGDQDSTSDYEGSESQDESDSDIALEAFDHEDIDVNDVPDSAPPSPSTPDVETELETPLVTSPSLEAAGTAPVLRRSSRARRPTTEWWKAPSSALSADLVLASHISVPQNVLEALTSPYAEEWQEAIDREFGSLMENNTWELVPLPPDRKLVGSKWVFKIKQNADGTIDKFKARLVAQGFSQREGIDYHETFAPVINYTALRVFFTLCAAWDYNITHLDYSTAFLNGVLNEPIYMRQPPGFESTTHPNYACRLRRTLYGLKQSPREWNKVLHSALDQNGFQALVSTPCLYAKAVNGGKIMIAVFVDDVLVGYDSALHSSAMSDLVADLSRRHKLTDLGEVSHFLGMAVQRDRPKRLVTLSQSQYAKEILTRFNLESAKPRTTPLPAGLKLVKAAPNDTNANAPYCEAVGCLMYLAHCTRPDLAQATATLSRYMSHPTEEHWRYVKQTLRYLLGTLDRGLTLGGYWYNAKEEPPSISLSAFSDSDWATCPSTRRSCTGYLIQLPRRSTISWRSRLQPTVATSTSEAEYMALSDLAHETIWLRNLLTELDVVQSGPTNIWADNQGANAHSKDPKNHSRMKHIDTRYHFIREKQRHGFLLVNYIPSKDNPADLFTKPLGPTQFEHLRLQLSHADS